MSEDTGPSISPTRVVSTASLLDIVGIFGDVNGRVEWSFAGAWVATDDPGITLEDFATSVSTHETP